MDFSRVEFQNTININAWLHEKEWTLTELQKKSGILYRTLTNVRKTGRADYETMLKLANAFEIPIPYLFIKSPKLMR